MLQQFYGVHCLLGFVDWKVLRFKVFKFKANFSCLETCIKLEQEPIKVELIKLLCWALTPKFNTPKQSLRRTKVQKWMNLITLK